MTGADYSRIHNPDLTEHYVYRILGKRGRLLYIGCSMNLRQRLHRYQNLTWGHLIGSVEIEGPYNYADGRAAEKAAIQANQPAFNTEWTLREQRGTALCRRTSTAAAVRKNKERAA